MLVCMYTAGNTQVADRNMDAKIYLVFQVSNVWTFAKMRE